MPVALAVWRGTPLEPLAGAVPAGVDASVAVKQVVWPSANVPQKLVTERSSVIVIAVVV